MGQIENCLDDILEVLKAGGGGGGGTSVVPLSVGANGTYTAPSGTAYSPVTVNVPSGGGATTKIFEGLQEELLNNAELLDTLNGLNTNKCYIKVQSLDPGTDWVSMTPGNINNYVGYINAYVPIQEGNLISPVTMEITLTFGINYINIQPYVWGVIQHDSPEVWTEMADITSDIFTGGSSMTRWQIEITYWN